MEAMGSDLKVRLCVVLKGIKENLLHDVWIFCWHSRQSHTTRAAKGTFKWGHPMSFSGGVGGGGGGMA